MSTPPSSSRRRTFDLPKSSPDAGLAEWTSKIKAIQQEVDRDEEAEQRKLQDEITRSRMERARRRNTATGSTDWLVKRARSPSNEASEHNAPTMGQQAHQPDALRPLTAASPSTSPPGLPKGSVSSAVSHDTKSEGISLAAFMGGRATGPKLNKPAPQQNSYDPTLFDQTRREGPHPIFGRISGAVALETAERGHTESRPGSLHFGETDGAATSSQESSNMIKRSTETTAKSVVHHTPSNRAIHLAETTPGIRSSTPPEIPTKPSAYRKPSSPAISTPDLKPDSGHVRVPPKLPAKPTISRQKSRDENLTFSGTSNSHPTGTPAPNPTSLAEMIGGHAEGLHLKQQESWEIIEESAETYATSRSGTVAQGNALPGMGGAMTPDSSRPLTLKLSSTPPTRPSIQQDPGVYESQNADTSPKRLLSEPQIVASSLARPIQPQVIVQPSPIAAASSAVSPAFLRVQSSTQDLHPSLSRLQGRGFVEKQIKASADIHEGSHRRLTERSTGTGAGRRPTVLDRWQPAVTSFHPPLPSLLPPDKASYKEKNVEEDEESPALSRVASIQKLIRPRTTSPALGRTKTSTSEDATKEAIVPVRLPGMATSTSFPKQQRPREGGRVVHEPTNASVGKAGTTQLTHPTRDRARKPRKPQEPRTVPSMSASQPQVLEQDGASKPVDTNAEQQGHFSSPKRGQNSTPEESSVVIGRLKDDLLYPGPTQLSWDSESRSPKVAPDMKATEQVLPATKPPSPSAARPTSPTSSTSEETSLSPSRHSRIPSTGHRATVMDVAQALQEHEQHIRESSLTPEPDITEHEEVTPTDVTTAVASWGRNVALGVHQAERRRSGYDRHSIVTLPPLVEEMTPAPTPQGSLSRNFTQTEASMSSVHDISSRLQSQRSSEHADEKGMAEVSVENAVESVARSPMKSIPGPPEEHAVEIAVNDAPVVESVAAEHSKSILNSNTADTQAEQEIELEHHDRPPPGFNLHSLLKEVTYSPDPQTSTISVEVISISGHTATAVTREPNVFYDSEVNVVVHRAKEKISGLVSTKLWAWRGKDAELGDLGVRKVAELAGRFGTKETHCSQGSEPHEVIHVLGGVLAIRQGKRAHWTVENTAMHRVHRVGDSIFVDEIDLAIHKLCSAYSYCLSVLDALYVWHGRGSSEDERRVASAYGQSLVTEKMSIIECEEGAEDEMFWMMLGDECFANASHWKFRHQLDRTGARLYKIDCARAKAPVQLATIFSSRDLPDDGVFVVDCRFELFVVITPPARGKRRDIQLALFLSENLSVGVSDKRPFDPPVHVVVLPSKLPLELQAAIRLCDEAGLNAGSVPDHMNLLSLHEALDHMKRRSWPKSMLSDTKFLPLGIEPQMLQL